MTTASLDTAEAGTCGAAEVEADLQFSAEWGTARVLEKVLARHDPGRTCSRCGFSGDPTFFYWQYGQDAS